MSESAGRGQRQVWRLSAVIEATEEEADQALQAIGLALCPDPNHPDHCPVPWIMMACRFDDLDDHERASWQTEFDEDRRRAEEADHGEP